jgi:hypothetical protein
MIVNNTALSVSVIGQFLERDLIAVRLASVGRTTAPKVLQ